jgi:Flp pilus assembly protein TadD
MSRSGPDDVARLRREVDHALDKRLDAEELLPLLARLARAAPEASEDWVHAHRHLAEIGVEHDPWRAAIFARRVVRLHPDDDGAWAVLGLSQSLLGNYRFAAHAYRRALRLTPNNPWYAHNLGHLYDVALGRPKDALPLLEQATKADTGQSDIAASSAHALARCGEVALAKRVLKRALRHGATSEQMALSRWLDQGAPASPAERRAEPTRKKPKRRSTRESVGE